MILLFAGYRLAFPARVCYDTTKVIIKLPQEEKIKEFQSKKEFNYTTEVVPSPSFLDRIWDWIGRMVEKFFSNEGLAPFIRYSIIAGMVVIIVFSLMKVKIQSLFYKNKKQNTIFIEPGELELLKTNIDELINKEIQNKNYRLAIRYLYLKLLKTLNDKEIINMQMSKTNDDYKQEMLPTRFNADFKNLSDIFEYVFYGNFSVEKNIFDKVNSDFNKIFISLDE